MAANAAWTQFVGLLDVDGVKDDGVGASARALKSALADYITRRFGTADITYLVDIVNTQAVVAAVVTNLTNIANDDAAIKAAVESVVPPVEP